MTSNGTSRVSDAYFPPSTQSNCVGNEKLQKSGLPIPQFNEEEARNEGYSKAEQYLRQSDDKKQEDRWYRAAFDARNARDAYLPLLPIVPVSSGLLLLAIYWVVRGFRKP